METNRVKRTIPIVLLLVLAGLAVALIFIYQSLNANPPTFRSPLNQSHGYEKQIRSSK